jgi:hypothetical protein
MIITDILIRFHSNELFKEERLDEINKWYQDHDVPLIFWIKNDMAFSQMGEFPAHVFATHD